MRYKANKVKIDCVHHLFIYFVAVIALIGPISLWFLLSSSPFY